MRCPSCSPVCLRSSRAGRSLAQDQYLEIRTLLSGYLLSSQGDRMLMAHSVEGRFPFLDDGRGRARELAAARVQAARPRREARPEAGRGAGRAAGDHRPQEAAIPRAGRAVLRRLGRASPMSRRAVAKRRSRDAGVFDPGAVAQLWASVGRRRQPATATFSNADNMALVGVLSTQLLHQQFIASRPARARHVSS